MANIVACLVVLTFVVQQTSCTDDISNTVSAVGTNIKMRCKTRTGNCSDVTWGIGSSAISIYKGEVGFRGNYSYRYSVDNTSGCHLTLKNVQLMDAGRLSCVDESSSPTIARSAELIVLESEPECHVSADAETTAEGDRVDLSCEVTFNGTNNVNMTWKNLIYVPASAKTGRTVRLSHAVTAERPIVPSYECVASFEIVREGTSLVPNIPTANCKTPSIKILYGVKSVELTPSLSLHFPGSVVTCSCDGNPPPSFKWQESEMENGSWKDVADVAGPEFTTTNETSLYYRCIASNVVKNVNYTATSPAFRVIYPAATTTAETVTDSTNFQLTSLAPDAPDNFQLASLVPIAAGASAGVILLVIIVIVICCCVRKSPCYHCCSSQTTSKGSSKAIDAKSTREHELLDYDNVELKKDGNTAVPSQAAHPATETTYASLQEQEDSHCYSSLAEEEKKLSQK